MTSKAFATWYEKNGGDYNAKRRKRYAENAEYRDKMLAGTRSWRQKVRATKASADEGPIFYSIGEAAKKIGRDIQTIRAWEAKEYIPRTDDGRGYRSYTEGQVTLMTGLAEFLAALSKNSPMFKGSPDYRNQVAEFVQTMRGQWDGNQVCE